jgi:ADP-ribosylglycohydrolase
VRPGQVTDDTQQACALFSSVWNAGRYDLFDAAQRYQAWRAVAFDIGAQTSRVLDEMTGGGHPVAAGRAVWEASGRYAAGNGSLMRCAPIAVLFAGDGRSRRRASVDDSALTHFDPRCQLACAAYNGAIARALQPGARTVEQVFDAAETDLAAAAWYLQRAWPELAEEVAAAQDALAHDLAVARRDDPELYSDELHLTRMQGFVRVAFRLAFWELAHAPDFASGVVDTVNRGGDADTNGAIVGGLLGAFHGQPGIPAHWIDQVLGALPEVDGDPLTTAYHPRQFLRLVRSTSAES